MQADINFLQSLLSSVRERGWSESRLSISLAEDANQPLHVSFGTLIPKAADAEIDAIYISPSTIDRRDAEAILRLIPKLSEHKTKKLFELISAAENLSADLGLPADFINPLTAMAEQLRTNILPRPEPEDEIPF